MEQNNWSGSIEHQNVVPEVSNNGKHEDSDHEGTSNIDGQNERLEATSEDEDLLDHDKTVGYAPSTSFSSSSSSNLDIDYDENDALDVSLSSSEEDGSGSTRADSESLENISTATPQWSMISGSPLAGPTTPVLGPSQSPEAPPQTSSLKSVNSSPKQSPAIQVMGRLDSNRIPSSVFAAKAKNAAEWSVASNESLFSIHMGNRPNDLANYPCFSNYGFKSNELTGFSSGLSTVMETASENEQKSASTVGEPGENDLFEIQSDAPIAPTNVDENLQVSEGKVSNPADGPWNSGSNPHLSGESSNTTSSFAFPVIVGNGSSKKSGSESPPPPVVPQENAVEENKSNNRITTPKTCCNRWFNCFPCCASCG